MVVAHAPIQEIWEATSIPACRCQARDCLTPGIYWTANAGTLMSVNTTGEMSDTTRWCTLLASARNTLWTNHIMHRPKAANQRPLGKPHTDFRGVHWRQGGTHCDAGARSRRSVATERSGSWRTTRLSSTKSTIPSARNVGLSTIRVRIQSRSMSRVPFTLGWGPGPLGPGQDKGRKGSVSRLTTHWWERGARG